MKKLALFLFAILILGCDTETPVVEEPEPIIQEHTPTAASGERFRFSGDVPQDNGLVNLHRRPHSPIYPIGRVLFHTLRLTATSPRLKSRRS